MKKICPFVFVCAAIFTLVSASVWEGAAAAAGSGELPETGLYLATNSFPANTAVDVTNLENGKTVRVIVSSDLENPGLLALLSKEAADAIGVESRTLSRIRMSQSDDPIAFSRFTEGLPSSFDPDYNPAAFVALNDYSFAETAEGGLRMESGDSIVDLDDAAAWVAAAPADPVGETMFSPVPDPASGPVLIHELTLVPAENRPPESENDLLPDPAYFVSPIGQAPVTDSEITESAIDPALIIPSIVPAAASASAAVPEQIFSAPLINNLETGKYYLQIAAFSKAETVQTELSKIDRNLPLAVMNAGSAGEPVYRILIGPVNQGESGALLQRFKTAYKDAFVRLGT